MSSSFEGALAPRRRNGWEAADSGILLWRDSWGYILLFLAVPVTAVAVVPCFIPPVIPFWFRILLLWWLKPLFDRPVLHIISVRFFEPGAPVRRFLRGLGGALGRGLAGDLLWRRFSPRRSAVMPVVVLEKLRAGEARRRKNILRRGGLNFAVFLTLFGVTLEIVILAGEVIFTFIMGAFSPFVFSRLEKHGSPEFFLLLAYAVNYIFLEGLYVCMGFGIYINSRVKVEGWDIQLLFRNFAVRKKIPPVLLGCLILGVFLPGKGFADPGIPLPVLEQILDSADFGGEVSEWDIRLKNRGKPEVYQFSGPVPWMDILREGSARGLRLVLMVAASLALILFLAIRFRYLRREWFPTDKRRIRVPPGVVPDSPESLLEEARAFYARGDIREAWSRCFSAAIAAYGQVRRLSIPADATEYECLSLVRAAASDTAGDFAFLLRNWISLAYGGIPPDLASFERSLDFCRSLAAAPGADHA